MENTNYDRISRRGFLAGILATAMAISPLSQCRSEDLGGLEKRATITYQNGKPKIEAIDFHNNGKPDKFALKCIEYYENPDRDSIKNVKMSYHYQLNVYSGLGNGQYNNVPVTAFDFGTKQPLALKFRGKDLKSNIDLYYLTQNSQGSYEVRVAKGNGNGTFGKMRNKEFSESQLVKDYGKEKPKDW